MKNEIIILRKNSFTYNNERYNIEELRNLDEIMHQCVTVVILQEELYSKHFYISNKRNGFVKFIERKIKNEFPQNGDILYDYEECENNIVAIYSIKGKSKIAPLEKYIKELHVKPIQVIIRSILKSLLKEESLNIKALVKFEEYYYYICLKKGLFYECIAEKNFDFVINKIIEQGEGGLLISNIDLKQLEMLKNIFKIKYIKMEDYINEKIYEKQKFYIRKLL